MKQFLKWTGLILFGITVGLGLAIVFAATVRVQSPVAVVQRAITQATPSAVYGGPWGYGYGDQYGSIGAYTPTRPIPYYGYGSGMMGGHMGGMMGSYSGWGSGYGVAPQGTPAPVDEEIQLTTANFRFDPATITATVGETVRLIVANQDSTPHNLYSPDVPIAYTLLPGGVFRSATFTAPTATGTYLAVCTFHPGMTLEIVVK